MAGRISEGSALTDSTIADADEFEVVDKSDTSLAATGTNKKIIHGNLRKASLHSFVPYGGNVATDTQGAIESIEDRIAPTAFLDDLDVAIQLVDHFLGGGATSGIIGELGWLMAVGASGGITDTAVIVDGTCGQIAISTGVDAGGYCELQLRSGNTGGTPFGLAMHGAPVFAYEVKLRVPTLPTSAQDFTVAIGFCNKSTTASPTAGFWFSCPSFVTDPTPTWVCATGDPDTAITAADSLIPIVAAQDYRLRCVCDGAGTAYFYIDGVLVHTQTASTNFPDANVDSNSYAPTIKIRKTAGTTARLIRTDYFGLRYEYS